MSTAREADRTDDHHRTENQFMQEPYRVVPGPPLSPSDVAAESLEVLAASLNAFDHPAASALDDLTVEMVELAFNSLRPKDRQGLLRHLGIRMAAPRRAGTALCQDILTRLRRDARQRTCRWGLMTLTRTVLSDLERAVSGPDTGGSALLSRWGGTLVGAAVFAWCQASVADARLIDWAVTHGCFALASDGPEAKLLDDLRAAASLVVKAYPEYVPPYDGVGEHRSPTDHYRERPPRGQANDREEELPDASTKTSTASDDASSPVNGVLPAAGGTEGGTETPEDACRTLALLFEDAVRAVQEVATALDDGRAPECAHLSALDCVPAAVERTRAVLAGAGVAAESPRLADLTRAAKTHAQAQERDEAVRRGLHALLAIRGAADGSVSAAEPAAETVRQCARRLLALPVWKAADREEGAALVGLAQLISLGHRDGAAAEILALQEQVVRAVPSCAAAVAMAPLLTVPTGEEPAPTGPEQPVTLPSDGPVPPTDGARSVPPEPGSPAVIPAQQQQEPAPARESQDVEHPAVAEQPATEPPSPVAGTTTSVPPGPHGGGPAPEPPVVSSGRAVPEEGEPESVPAAAAGEGLPAATSPAPAPGGQTHPAEHTTATVRETAGGQGGAVPGATVEAASLGDVQGETDRALARLVTERRFGLAHHLARVAGRPESQVVALRLAGAAALLTSGSSQGARLVADLLGQQSGFTGQEAEGSELILLPALLKAALVTGDHVAGAQLKNMVHRLPDGLAEVATTVADRALSGALMIASPLVVIADASETEARLRELREQCAVLAAPQRLRFARATDIAKRWLSPKGGLLGTLLTAVVEDDRERLPAVRETVERLSKQSELNNEIDRMDRDHRPSSGKPLQGSGRQDLVHLVERSVGLAKEWCLTAEGARRGERTDKNRAAKEISALRRLMLTRRDTVLAELEALAGRPGSAAAAAAAAHDSMAELFGLLTGGATAHHAGPFLAPETILDAELLKVSDAVDEPPSPERLLIAVDRSWQDGLRERLGGDAFTAARTIVELAALGVLPAIGTTSFDEETLAGIAERENARRAELCQEHDELVAELHRAQADGAATDDQDLRIQELLADARTLLDDGERRDLVDVRRALDAVRTDLPKFRREATDRIRARLAALDITEDERSQVLRHLDTGGLATAADLVYFLEIGEPVPEIEAGESHLTEFFPIVPDRLPRGIDSPLVGLVRSGGRHSTVSVLDYGSLSDDEAGLAADALDEWRELGATEPKDRPNINARLKLLPALKLLGYDAKSARPLEELSPQRREYRFFEVTGVEVNGRAKVPAFGSQIKEQGGNLRVLMLWGRPPAEVVMSLASRDPSETSLLIAYFGTLGQEARTELAAGSDRLQPLLVVDDAALAYLAARGNRQVSTATQILLPFSGVNPYIREKRGRIGGEMFYGRDAERKSILDPRGTQVIFGGRGLGKSALLSDAGERFTEQRPGYHESVYVNLDQENIGKGSSFGPEALWSVLERELTEAEVLGRCSGRKAQKKDVADRVRAGIREWVQEDSRRRLLILLDECDQFFEADAPRFDQTKRLKGLGSDTKDRVKVVFAGLHSVQRFSKMASNGPFSHLAQTPKVIGPLAPQFAADLLVEPMRALGFEFADVDMVNRVLGYCSYQPFLLQMFGHRLVEVMHRKRARRGTEGPPYTVDAGDIEVVEADAGLRAGISAAFKDTLSLDHRYDVIANVLAYHARRLGLEVRLSDAELREECETWWKRGFEQLDTEGFRAYLSEMVGLGVLAPNHDGQGWHLRGPNALRMIGSSHEVEARLLRAEQECELGESTVLEGRPDLSDGRLAPLTITQLDDLLGERANQTRVVLGTLATGIKDVGDTLRAVAGRIADWTLPPIGRPSVFKQELLGGRHHERRVIISDFARYPAKPDTCRDSVDLAESLLPVTPGVTRAVVLVTDTGQLDLWRLLLMGEERTSASPVILRRHDRRSLRGWAQRVEDAEVFDSDERVERLYAVTGGWPFLVDRVHRLHRELADPEEALQRQAKLVQDPVGAREFVDASALYAHRLLAAGYQAVAAEFGGDWTDEATALTAIACRLDDEDEARWVLRCLDALQVFDRDGEDRRLEPLLRQCVALGG
ncbi:hypothetical protein [Streptomyces sp. BBFR102]|uniref:hypothetical protein n=1 Tax=Streptomyces sp. BBFR102 TaxID=3448171 RepID=UPI003F5306FF